MEYLIWLLPLSVLLLFIFRRAPGGGRAMTSPAGQGESCSTGQQPSPTAPIYCSACGRPADGTIRRGSEPFCSRAHAEEFAREVAAARASSEARR